MSLFNNTPSDSTLNRAAYCVLYEVIKEGINNIVDLRNSLLACIGQCDTLSIEERKEIKPVYERAYEIACQNNFEKAKQLASQVGSDFTKDL